jgi:alkylation response protein AidB-like acyl-CoA dehydrogenase
MTARGHEIQLIEATKRFVADYVMPSAPRWERDRELPREAFTRAAALGLTAIEVPTALGGKGCSFTTKAKIAELLATADFGFAMAVINTHNVAKKFADNPNFALGRLHLPDLISAKRIGCTALTEPGTGSDFAAITTLARPSGDGWLISGEKAWITNATCADSIIAYVQTREVGDASAIAAFAIDARRDGFHRGPSSDPIGLHSNGSGGFTLNEYVARGDEMIGAPGEAFKAILGEINGARIYVAAMACGMMQSALDAASAYGAQRQSFGQALSAHQGWRWRLAEASADLAAAQALVASACRAFDAGEDVQCLAAQTKIMATRMAERHLPALTHAMGAEGLKMDQPFGRHLVGLQFCGLVDGSTEMLLERVARLIRPA